MGKINTLMERKTWQQAARDAHLSAQDAIQMIHEIIANERMENLDKFGALDILEIALQSMDMISQQRVRSEIRIAGERILVNSGKLDPAEFDMYERDERVSCERECERIRNMGQSLGWW